VKEAASRGGPEGLIIWKQHKLVFMTRGPRAR